MEVNELAGVYCPADRVSDLERERVQSLTRSYARVAIEEEWSLMERGQTSSRTSSLLNKLRLSLQDLDTRRDTEQVLYDQGSRGALAFGRQEAPVAGGHRGPAQHPLGRTHGRRGNHGWLHLPIRTQEQPGTRAEGGGPDARHRRHTLTIGSLEYPFAGEIRVQPDAFEEVLRNFEEV